MQEENQIRSFIVLMDKNKDTQWLEDGVFVPNPLAEFDRCCDKSTASMFGKITGLSFVKEVNGEMVSPNQTRYVVKGYQYASDNSISLLTRVVTVHK